jgi:hypothetical protein
VDDSVKQLVFPHENENLLTSQRQKLSRPAGHHPPIHLEGKAQPDLAMKK